MSDQAAAFDALYVAPWGIEMNETTDRTFTSAPPPLSRNAGAKARAICIEPKKFAPSRLGRRRLRLVPAIRSFG